MNTQFRLLEKAALENKLAHLLIFHGGSAQDRRDFSWHLAQILNCLSLLRTGPCQICQACRKIRSGNHPDVSNMEPAKTMIGIDQVLDWQDRLYKKHFEGKHKVFLIEQADNMTVPAANALLKVAEEPPERTIIILSAQNAEGILPTLRSRAQMVFFANPKQEEWLSRFKSEEAQAAKEAFLLSGENPDLAMQIVKYGVEETKEWLQKFWAAVKETDFLKVFALFPLEREQALVYLQAVLVQTEEKVKGGYRQAPVALAIGQAIEAITQQANPRLAIEVLVLKIIRAGREG